MSRTLSLLLRPAAVAVVGAVALRLVLQAYSIPSPSMSPALEPGDHVLATRLFGDPAAGDVVVFRHGEAGEHFVKRVIAGPGQLVEIRDRMVHVDGQPLVERYVAGNGDPGALPALVVPDGHYFVMGDNREYSLDSRAWGPVPRELIEARVRLVFWSSAVRPLYETASASTGATVPVIRRNPLDRIGWVR